jgi:hypothetical protein
MTSSGDLLQSIGRLFITSSRCEWYIGEILVEAKLGKGHSMPWKKGSDRLMLNAKIIADLISRDSDQVIRETVKLSETFRNRFAHDFLGKCNNAEGWIELRKKMLVESCGEKITKEEVNRVAAIGDIALSGYKQILLPLYHLNGKM